MKIAKSMRSTPGKLAVGSLVLLLLVGLGVSHVRAQRGGAGGDQASNLVPEPASIPELIESVQRHENPLVRFHAAYALGNLGPEARTAVPALVAMLRSDDHDETEIAAFVLARIAPDPAVEAAVPLLTETVQGLEKGWPARFNAAVALLKLGREEEKARAVTRDVVYLGLMLPFLQDDKPLNRLHICEALRFFGPPQRDFLDLLRKTAAEDPDARVREAAVKALREVAAAEHAGASAGEAPQALATLPPELAEAGKALIESNTSLETDDLETYKKSLSRESRKEFERDPRTSFFAAKVEDILPALRLLGGTREGDSARIDFFSRDWGIYHHGTMSMVREGGRWVKGSKDWYNPALDQPAIDESTPPGKNEQAAFDALKAIGAAQIDHWNRSSPPTYASSLARLLPREGPQAEHILDGYVITMTTGARSNGVYHAWSAEAHPVRYKETGVYSYYADERGIVLRADTRGKPLLLKLPER